MRNRTFLFGDYQGTRIARGAAANRRHTPAALGPVISPRRA